MSAMCRKQTAALPPITLPNPICLSNSYLSQQIFLTSDGRCPACRSDHHSLLAKSGLHSWTPYEINGAREFWPTFQEIRQQ